MRLKRGRRNVVRAWREPDTPFPDAHVSGQLRTLQAVDEAVPTTLDAMAGARYPTVYVCVSDQGFMWGEHGAWGKGTPHEESIRVPFVIVVPAAEALTVKALDLGPTMRAGRPSA